MQLLEVGSSKAANVFCWLKSLESQTAICGQQKAFTFRIHSVAFCIAKKSDERSIHHGLTVLKNFSNTHHFWGLKNGTTDNDRNLRTWQRGSASHWRLAASHKTRSMRGISDYRLGRIG